MNSIITRKGVHTCGWESDGGAFLEGAGCPNCGEQITAESWSSAVGDDPIASDASPPTERHTAELPPVGDDPIASPPTERHTAELPPVGDDPIASDASPPTERSPEVGDDPWFARLTVAEAEVHISGIDAILDLSLLRDMELDGKNRKGVLAAIKVRCAILVAVADARNVKDSSL